MDWKHLLLSFEGRAIRAKYWLVAALSFAIMLFAALVMAVAPGLGLLLVAVFSIALIWPAVAVGVKRLHDRDKSGWWLLLFYFLPGVLGMLDDMLGGTIVLGAVSLAISVWALVELGFLRGTVGPNRYGPDPLAAT